MFFPKKIQNGYLVGESTCYGPDDANCCPSIHYLSKVKLVNGKLLSQGREGVPGMSMDKTKKQNNETKTPIKNNRDRLDDILKNRKRAAGVPAGTENGVSNASQLYSNGKVDMNNYVASRQEDNRREIKSAIYCLYVKTLSSIRDIDVMNYYDAFDPLPDNLNEFQQKKILLRGKEKLDSIKNDATVMAYDREFISSVNFGEYNFEKNGFAIKQIDNEAFFTLLSKGTFEIQMNIVFQKVNRGLFIPFDATKAEELINNHSTGKERIAYCIYTFDYLDTKFAQNTNYTCMITQNAQVKSIDFYLDKQCTQKFATISLN